MNSEAGFTSRCAEDQEDALRFPIYLAGDHPVCYVKGINHQYAMAVGPRDIKQVEVCPGWATLPWLLPYSFHF